MATLAATAPLEQPRALPLGRMFVNPAFDFPDGVQLLNAFFWAALFHGVQYLTIAAIFHVCEQTRRPENRRGWAFHVGIFYGASVALGYVLFVLWPDAYVALGYEPLLTAQLVVAVINIHHFVVDAYIWRLRRDPNLRTVVDQPVPAEA